MVLSCQSMLLVLPPKCFLYLLLHNPESGLFYRWKKLSFFSFLVFYFIASPMVSVNCNSVIFYQFVAYMSSHFSACVCLDVLETLNCNVVVYKRLWAHALDFRNSLILSGLIFSRKLVNWNSQGIWNSSIPLKPTNGFWPNPWIAINGISFFHYPTCRAFYSFFESFYAVHFLCSC